MKKEFGAYPWLYPMPTLMISTYNEDDSVDVMMMAWGGICDTDKVALNLEAEHKTVENLRKRKAFTIAVPGVDTLKESDYFGIVSGNDVPDKFAISGLHAYKSSKVDAPIVEEYKLTLECEVMEMQDQPYGLRVLGKIVSIQADEEILDEKGKIDVTKIHAFAFDQMRNGYYELGPKVGQAWDSGRVFIKK